MLLALKTVHTGSGFTCYFSYIAPINVTAPCRVLPSKLLPIMPAYPKSLLRLVKVILVTCSQKRVGCVFFSMLGVVVRPVAYRPPEKVHFA